jgi:hypothetical protein
MPLPSSGQITLNEMHVEASGTSGTQSNINSAPIRGLINKSASVQMAFTEWYGASSGPPPAIAATGTTTQMHTMVYVPFNNPFANVDGYVNGPVTLSPSDMGGFNPAGVPYGSSTLGSCSPSTYTGWSGAQFSSSISYQKTNFGNARLEVTFNQRRTNSNWNTMRHSKTINGQLTIPRTSMAYATYWTPGQPTTTGQTKYTYTAPPAWNSIYYQNSQTNYVYWT